MPDVLINVHVLVSEVIPADIQEVWRRVAAFTRLGEWVMPGPSGEQLTSLHLAGSPPEYTLGCQRIISIDGASYAEQLNAIDAERHTMSYFGVNAEGAVNPFPGSLLDYRGTIRCLPVTLSSQTYIEWTLDFKTEPEGMKLAVTPPAPVEQPQKHPIGSFMPLRSSPYPSSALDSSTRPGYEQWGNPNNFGQPQHSVPRAASQASGRLDQQPSGTSSIAPSAPAPRSGDRQRRFKVSQFPP